jgi:hypothetical protein
MPTLLLNTVRSKSACLNPNARIVAASSCRHSFTQIKRSVVRRPASATDGLSTIARESVPIPATG